MILYRLRRSATIASTLVFTMSLFALRPAFAAESVEPVPAETPVPSPVVASELSAVAPAAAPDTRAAAVTPLTVAVGGDHSAVSDESIAVPQGAGKVSGMGESFSTQASTGVAVGAIEFALPAARGAAKPSLALVYSSADGHGNAGVGWKLEVPSISRQTDRGLPGYADPANGGDWIPQQDRFLIGHDELVAICLVQAGGSCARAQSGEVMPGWAAGWQYFRRRIENSFERFFWSPDHRTWRVQDKSGVTSEFGVPLDGSNDAGALESDPANQAHIYRWSLARQFDPHGGIGAPVNVVVYKYLADNGVNYLQDVFDTPPAASAAAATLDSYAHHVHLVYQARPDVLTSYRSGWAMQHGLRLFHVDVTSKLFTGGGAREQVRRYWASYDSTSHVSLLTAVQLEGKCDSGNPVEDATQLLPASTGCPSLPATTFSYTHSQALDASGNTLTPDLPGYEAFDNRVRPLAGSPSVSIDGQAADLYDLDGDSLPDVLATTSGFGSADGAFLQGSSGTVDSFGATTIGVNGLGGDTWSSLTFKNTNVSLHDLDGDGLVDLVHMPQAQQYYIYTPTQTASGWMFQGRQVATASGQNIQLNFSNDNANIKTMDVNGDGLVDLVYSTGTSYESFLALGRYAGGVDQYGNAQWTSNASATISNVPLNQCVPTSSTAARLGDADVRVADVNGDGLPDVVRVRSGDIRYWPGRGNGLFGIGQLDNCPSSVLGTGRDIAMTTPPQLTQSGAALKLEDVNGDGLADLVQVRANAIDIWLNVDGSGWTGARHTVTATIGSASNGHVRIADVNGSGTRDILWADGGNYRYLDFMGGQRPWLLAQAANGLGKTTTYQYANSASLMIADAQAGNPWTTKIPLPVHVVTQVTESDNLSLAGRLAAQFVTNYAYRDPLYDGRQREFRGFATTRTTRQGDDNSPTAITESHFLLGECEEEAGGVPSCDAADLWRDNPREALKGLPVASDQFDAAGNYLSSEHHTYRLRRLYLGSDGREVRHVFVSQSDSYHYDDGPFIAGTSSVTLTDVELELQPGILDTSVSRGVTLHGGGAIAHLHQETAVDSFGNTTDAIDAGCVDGCDSVDERLTTHTTPDRPAQDSSGWLWRLVETYVSGTSSTTQWKHTFSQYDGNGDLLTVTAALSGTLLLQRQHEDPTAAVAPTPATAAQDGIVPVSSKSYDSFGNLLTEAGAHGRCRNVTWDQDYAELATIETVLAGAAGGDGCGTTSLSSVATYDRGLGAVTMVVDLHGELTTVAYNGFGWPTELHEPSPLLPGTVTSIASVRNSYVLPSDWTETPYTIVHSQTQDGADTETSSYADAWAYGDGLGRVVITLKQADPSAGDGGGWIASGLTDYDAKGAARQLFEPWFWSGDPSAFPLTTAPTTAFHRKQYDAFGRLYQTYALDGALDGRHVYHALSEDHWDEADLESGPHQNTPSSERHDGHGRTIATVERIGSESHELRTQYLPGGEKSVLTRVRVGASDAPVVRWLRYDSLGRMTLNVEPDTSAGFNGDPSADPSTIRAWRYAYNDDGELIGTSDARGCGENYWYDAAGRLVAEDYSPCLSAQPAYSAPDLLSGDGTEVFNVYDAPSADEQSIPNFTIDSSLCSGRLVSVADRGAETVSSFDGRGRVVGLARRVARPGNSDSVAARYTAHWFLRGFTLDGADRVTAQDSGADVPELLGTDGKSSVTIAYTKRGGLRSVGGSYGALVTGLTHDADGLNTHIGYGDFAGTTTDFTYDPRRRLATVVTQRGAPAAWSGSSGAYSPSPVGAPNLQLLLQSLRFGYDSMANPTSIEDLRDPDEWPAGAKPASRTQQYDDLYRLTEIDYQFANSDAWVSPFASEDQGVVGAQQAMPAPHLALNGRMLRQSFGYDWLGNTVATDDDAGAFYDRSLGTIANGPAAPYQLTGASNESASDATRTGNLSARYDAAGELAELVLVRRGSCLPVGDVCSQHFVYDWDEVGRLARARRWDMTDPGSLGATPVSTPAVELRYSYGGDDQRVLKTAIDPDGNQLYTAYVFPSLELRRTGFDGTDYQRTPTTEVPYLLARSIRVGRVGYGPADLPSMSGGQQHVFLEIPDQLGSSTMVIDQATSELVEGASYQAFGGTDSDYRPSRWEFFREDHRFTGKEDDVELGLTYFGKRYYAPLLQRWISPDPLAIHALDADLNVYAYLQGRVFVAVDPQGLQAAPLNFDKGAKTFFGGTEGIMRAMLPVPLPTPQSSGDATYDGSRAVFEAVTGTALIATGTHMMWGGGGVILTTGWSGVGALAGGGTFVAGLATALKGAWSIHVAGPRAMEHIHQMGGKSASGGSSRPPEAKPSKAPAPTAPEPQRAAPAAAGSATGQTQTTTKLEHAPNFDAARQRAFEAAGMTDPANVRFTREDPQTGTIVEFKGTRSQHVAYDAPHADGNPANGHDMPHVGYSTEGKGADRVKANITYDGEQHPYRTTCEEGKLDE